MSIIKKCDRCGVTYELYNVRSSGEKPNGFVFANIDSQMKYCSHSPKDLCPECMEEFRNWFVEGNGGK
jgi:hypothetical protein